ncbi:hypothetical protein GE061_004975 [Apolygus lucorum]|uniref:Reverse transcriptase zinc-binding domain-containing protein n=1 Tax=Apolygus lucorum TaxID=248454 RepID=A0A8S9WUW7_APOLU|nr:hypothetical protein GE061_004975 [Apolygus lucorum]
MANLGGPSPAKRRLLMRTTEAIMLYGAEVWADSLRYHKYRARMEAVQRRGALRISSASRTVSGPASQVIAGTIPIYHQALERRRIKMRKAEAILPITIVKREEREETICRWQADLVCETRGRWTALIIDDLKAWLERKHGEVNYYLTQFLSGHGYFRSFLVQIGKATDPECRYCGIEEDDVCHTFFTCPQWVSMRRSAEEVIGTLRPQTIIHEMIRNKSSWDAMAVFVASVLKAKKLDGRWEEEGDE